MKIQFGSVNDVIDTANAAIDKANSYRNNKIGIVGDALSGIGMAASMIPGWGALAGVGTALVGGIMSGVAQAKQNKLDNKAKHYYDIAAQALNEEQSKAASSAYHSSATSNAVMGNEVSTTTTKALNEL
jgi:hypothetical protein